MVRARTITIFALAVTFGLAGCSTQPKKAEKSQPNPAGGMSEMSEHSGTPAANAEMVTCPVSGHQVAKDKAFVMTYEGKEIRLCCSDCVEPFKAEPAKYMAVLEKNEAASH